MVKQITEASVAYLRAVDLPIIISFDKYRTIGPHSNIPPDGVYAREHGVEPDSLSLGLLKRTE